MMMSGAQSAPLTHNVTLMNCMTPSETKLCNAKRRMRTIKNTGALKKNRTTDVPVMLETVLGSIIVEVLYIYLFNLNNMTKKIKNQAIFFIFLT